MPLNVQHRPFLCLEIISELWGLTRIRHRLVHLYGVSQARLGELDDCNNEFNGCGYIALSILGLNTHSHRLPFLKNIDVKVIFAVFTIQAKWRLLIVEIIWHDLPGVHIPDHVVQRAARSNGAGRFVEEQRVVARVLEGQDELSNCWIWFW